MRKIVALLLFVLIVIACSTNSNSNGNTITVPPSNLTGVVVLSTQINLYWTDDLTEELGFKIERKIGTGNYVIVGTVNSDTLTYSDTGLTPGTTYTYRVYSYNGIDNSPTYSNELSLTTTNTMILPILTTTETSEITTTTAVSGGTISSNGASVVIAKGVVWSTSSNATIVLSTKTINDIGVGTYTSSITGLTANTTYYIRAYATNSFGTAYGNEFSFTTNSSTEVNVPGPNVSDIDGNVYQTVTNCNQTWTKTNLNTSHYRNGDGIPQVTDPIAWAKLKTGAWCYYNNDSANGTTYGKLYNWYAVNDSRGLVPIGYHIPTDAEWTTLTTCLGGASVAGGKMKTTTLWNDGIGIYPPPYTTATNSSGFSALPGGYRNSNGGYFYIRDYGYWWSSTEVYTEYAYDRYLIFYTNEVGREGINKLNGWSVRCVMD